MSFEQCDNCRLLTQNTDIDFQRCPIDNFSELDEAALQYIEKHAPLSRWKTAKEIAEQYNYSDRQVLRLADSLNNRIVARRYGGRWLILRCSFDLYMEGNHRHRSHAPPNKKAP